VFRVVAMVRHGICRPSYIQTPIHTPHAARNRTPKQGISEIQGLERCTALQHLWLPENRIASLSRLRGLTALRELHLYSNRLTATTGLGALTALEVLSLANNYITHLDIPPTLQLLRQLDAAANDISSVATSGGTGLSPGSCRMLNTLNLSANRIASFQELQPLAQLPALTDLCLFDPMWGGCPLACLPNYHTYALCLLPGVTSLDTLVVTAEMRAAATATLAKKQVGCSCAGGHAG